MEKKNKNGLVVVIVVAAIAATAYFIIKSKKDKKEPGTKAEMVDAILKSGVTKVSTVELMSRGDDYIAAWYDAVKTGKQFFVLNGLNYNTIGGARA